MAISPGSDIVLEVARAADPAGYRAAAARLERLADTSAATVGAFEDMLAATPPRPPAAPSLPFDAATALVRLQNRDALAAPPAKPYERFEAFVLQTFIESMLPESGEALYGSGTAGKIWKSMLAEQLGAQLARTGGIGVAEMLSAAHPDGGGPTDAAAAVQRTGADI